MSHLDGGLLQKVNCKSQVSLSFCLLKDSHILLTKEEYIFGFSQALKESLFFKNKYHKILYRSGRSIIVWLVHTTISSASIWDPFHKEYESDRGSRPLTFCSQLRANSVGSASGQTFVNEIFKKAMLKIISIVKRLSKSTQWWCLLGRTYKMLSMARLPSDSGTHNITVVSDV